jgi:hypothetical protein
MERQGKLTKLCRTSRTFLLMRRRNIRLGTPYILWATGECKCASIRLIGCKNFLFLRSFSSLGGALAQILAYEIATTGAMKELVNRAVNEEGEYGEYGEGSPRQVTVVTFGSPFVGNREFKKAFEEVRPSCMSL